MSKCKIYIGSDEYKSLESKLDERSEKLIRVLVNYKKQDLLFKFLLVCNFILYRILELIIKKQILYSIILKL